MDGFVRSRRWRRPGEPGLLPDVGCLLVEGGPWWIGEPVRPATQIPGWKREVLAHAEIRAVDRRFSQETLNGSGPR